MATDFIKYAERCLKIRTKGGSVQPFVLNGVQRLVHDQVQQQLRETGKVRVLILKARQVGISTYVEGRFYWKVTHRKGVRAFILTHRDQATSNLFDMAKRMHDNMNHLFKPRIRASNATELDFGGLDSGYRVGTAKAIGVGRAETIQFFHASEAAYWANADEHAAGVFQAIPDAPRTEIFVESTANGIGGFFYNLWKAASAGENDYKAIFIPWFWHAEYETTVPLGWRAPLAFIEYGELYGLRDEQLYWAFLKNAELAASEGRSTEEICWRFRQEYPATAHEAFQTSGQDSYITSESVTSARKNHVTDQEDMALIIGVDVGGGGRSKTAIIDRQGRRAGAHVMEKLDTEDKNTIIVHLARLIDRIQPDRMNIDVTGGYGGGVLDGLRARGYGNIISGVKFGNRAYNGRDYANRRAEMAGLMKEWFEDEAGVDIPDNDELHEHICAVAVKRFDANDRLVLQSKDDIPFPIDWFDSLGLTFNEPARALRTRSRPLDPNRRPTLNELIAQLPSHDIEEIPRI